MPSQQPMSQDKYVDRGYYQQNARTFSSLDELLAAHAEENGGVLPTKYAGMREAQAQYEARKAEKRQKNSFLSKPWRGGADAGLAFTSSCANCCLELPQSTADNISSSITCPHCLSKFYCSEECRQEDYQQNHKEGQCLVLALGCLRRLREQIATIYKRPELSVPDMKPSEVTEVLFEWFHRLQGVIDGRLEELEAVEPDMDVFSDLYALTKTVALGTIKATTSKSNNNKAKNDLLLTQYWNVLMRRTSFVNGMKTQKEAKEALLKDMEEFLHLFPNYIPALPIRHVMCKVQHYCSLLEACGRMRDAAEEARGFKGRLMASRALPMRTKVDYLLFFIRCVYTNTLKVSNEKGNEELLLEAEEAAREALRLMETEEKDGGRKKKKDQKNHTHQHQHQQHQQDDDEEENENHDQEAFHIFCHLGDFLVKRGSYLDALRVRQRQLNVSPRREYAYSSYCLVNVLCHLGRLQQAENLAKAVIYSRKAEYEAFLQRDAPCKCCNRVEQAPLHFWEDYIMLLTEVGIIHAVRGEHEAAVDIFLTARNIIMQWGYVHIHTYTYT
jgi:hypothetical protein